MNKNETADRLRESAHEENEGKSCGCKNGNIPVCLKETISIKDNIRARLKRDGFKKFVVDLLQGWFTSGDKKRFPKGVYKTQIVDKENNLYFKKVIDIATSKIIKFLKEKLTDHYRK